MLKRALATVALAAGLSAQTAGAESYVVGVESIDYYPQYTVRDGQYGGFARALLDAFAKDRGHHLEYRPLPVARLFQQFVNGDVDLKYPDNVQWSQELKQGKPVTYSAPVVAYIDGVSLPPTVLGKGADAIRALGTVRGFTAWDWLDRVTSGTVRLQENNDFTALLNATLAGRVDGAYANVAVVNHRLATEIGKPGALVFDPGLPHSKSHYHLSSIRHPELIAEFDAWMAVNGETVAAIKAEYAVEEGVR